MSKVAHGAQRFYGGKKTFHLDASEVYKGLEKMATAAPNAVKATIADVRSRGPGWIAGGVVQEYSITRSEVRGALASVYSGGAANFGGVAVDNVTFHYSGRHLTPVHFSMQPKNRPHQSSQYDEYDITMKVFKNRERKKIRGKSGKGKPFLAHSSSQGGKSIVFQRERKGGKLVKRLPISPFKTIAIPQMIQDGDGNTKPKVSKALNDGMEKRFQHHLKRYLW